MRNVKASPEERPQKSHDRPFLLGRERFRQILENEVRAPTKSAPPESEAATLVEQRLHCGNLPPKIPATALERRVVFQNDVGPVPLKTQAAVVERHVSFQDDAKPARFSEEAYAAQSLHRQGASALPLRSALRTGSKFAGTADVELMTSLCLPLLAALLWLLFSVMLR